MKKLKRVYFILFFLFSFIFFNLNNSFWFQTNNSSTPWTMDKAEHLARRTYFFASNQKILELYNAWSATNAVNLIFTNASWPNRTNYNQKLQTFTTTWWFNTWDRNSMYKYYFYKKYYDPYEPKAKFFLLFEDIFSVNNWSTISYQDIDDLHNLIYENFLWSYKTLVKKVFFNNWWKWDFAAWMFLDLFNQVDKFNPNENYARELLQLFLMWEYLPYESRDLTWAIRNYSEDDVAMLARIITWFEANTWSRLVSFNPAKHNTSTGMLFLSWNLNTWDSFLFYDLNSWTLNLKLMENSISSNNWLPDNTIDYIFSKRRYAIALFLADRIFRFYISDYPTKQELINFANIILQNDFNILQSTKYLLTSDLMYSDKAMNNIYYKNPVELSVWTLKLLHQNSILTWWIYPDDIISTDPNIMVNLWWTPYVPWSIFWRDWFDKNYKWISSYTHNQFVSYSTNIAYKTKNNSYNIDEILTIKKQNLTWNIDFQSSTSNDLTWNLLISNIKLIYSWMSNPNFTWFLISWSKWTVNFFGWNAVWPTLSFLNNSWSLFVNSWNIDLSKNKIYIFSWSFLTSWNVFFINSWNIDLLSWSNLLVDIDMDLLINQYENFFFNWKKIWTWTKDLLKQFLIYDENWNNIAYRPNLDSYKNIKLKWVVSSFLTLPEFILNAWWENKQQNIATWISIWNVNSKLIFIELYWWYDWLNWIVQKDEYDSYLTYRWSIAIQKENMIDLWNYYLNNSFISFKPFYDEWTLRIVNRVWTPNHSRAHDSAWRQIASFENNDYQESNWLYWKLISTDEDSSKTIVFWWAKPNIFRNWNYINIWYSSLDYKNYWSLNTKQKDQQLTLIKNILNQIDYSDSIKNVFKWSLKLDQVAIVSKNSWWKTYAGSSLEENFQFLEILLDNNLWTAFYVPWWWWYDTHSDQNLSISNTNDLNWRTKKLAQEISTFFNKVKSKHDVTIVTFSEFWRTTKVNWSNWTDHWQWWWNFIVSNNQILLQSLPNKIIWNLWITQNDENLQTVWIDYRSIFSVILKSLFFINPIEYFWANFDLKNDVDNIAPKLSLHWRNYKYYSNWKVEMDVVFWVNDTNFNYDKSSRISFFYWTDQNKLSQYSQYYVNQYAKQKDWTYKINIKWINEKSKYYYVIKLNDDQYNKFVFTWIIDTPYILWTTWNILSYSWDNLFRKYNNLTINSWSTSDLILYSWAWNNWFQMNFDWWIKIWFNSWTTFVNWFETSWNIVWNGWFILPKNLDLDSFFDEKINYKLTKINKLSIDKIIKFWSDTNWIWLRLNKKINISLPVSQDWNYVVLKSLDWINWTWFNWNWILSNSQTLNFDTDVLSYFLIYKLSDISCNFSISPKIVNNWSSFFISRSWTWWSNIQINNWIWNVENTGSIEVLAIKDSWTLNYVLTISNIFSSINCLDSIKILPSNKEIMSWNMISNLNQTFTWNKSFKDVFSWFWYTWENFTLNKVLLSWEFNEFISDNIVDLSWDNKFWIIINTWTNLYVINKPNLNFSKQFLNLTWYSNSSKKITYFSPIRLWNSETIVFDNYVSVILKNIWSSNRYWQKKSIESDWNIKQLSNLDCIPIFPYDCAYKKWNDIYINTYHLTDFSAILEQDLSNIDEDLSDNSNWWNSWWSSWWWWGGGWWWGYYYDDYKSKQTIDQNLIENVYNIKIKNTKKSNSNLNSSLKKLKIDKKKFDKIYKLSKHIAIITKKLSNKNNQDKINQFKKVYIEFVIFYLKNDVKIKSNKQILIWKIKQLIEIYKYIK